MDEFEALFRVAPTTVAEDFAKPADFKIERKPNAGLKVKVSGGLPHNDEFQDTTKKVEAPKPPSGLNPLQQAAMLREQRKAQKEQQTVAAAADDKPQ